MRMIIGILSILFILTGCAYSGQISEFVAGQSSVEKKDYQAAYDHFVKSYAALPSTSAANNAGAVASDMGNMEIAKAWFTLAAKGGDGSAIANLINHGWPVPEQSQVSNQAPVLNQAPQQQNNADLIAQCKSAMMGRATKTGTFSESLANAAECDANPNAHLIPQTQSNLRCVRDITGAVNCNSY